MFRGLNCDDNKNVIGGVVNDKNVNSYFKKSIYQELPEFGGTIINDGLLSSLFCSLK